ncbi:hypothetical protein ALC62_00214, partial [Cyphomyrmex costatus]
TGSKGCAATGEREREKADSGRDRRRKRGLDGDDDSGVNTVRSSGQSATKAPCGRSKHHSLIVPFASALIWYCVLCRAPTANSIDREREHRQLAAIVSIGANMTSFDQQFHCLTEKSVVDFIDPFHALMHLQYGKVKFIVPRPVNVDIHHKSTHTVSDRDEENTHPAQGVAARSQKRRAFIFCRVSLEPIMFRSNGDITTEWEAIANRFTPRCLVFASLVETRLRRSRAVE